MSQEEPSAYTCLIKEGYIMRQSAYLKQWKMKWIVLKGFCLLIFNQKPIDHATNDVIQIYDLTIYDDIHRINKNEFELFSISKNTTSTKFKTHTNIACNGWIKCIKKQQNKISINDNINDEFEDETNVLSSISQLIDDGFTYNETKLALQKSINDPNDNSDDGSLIKFDITTSFDPRCMFEMEQETNNKQLKQENESLLATALMSAINENMDEKTEDIVHIECDKHVLNHLNYSQISSSVQDLLSTTNDKLNDSPKNHKVKQSENVFEMKTMNTMDTMNSNISDLCVLATKQLQLLQNETNKNMIQIKKMNLLQTLNKIKESDTLQWTNMMKNKEWSMFRKKQECCQ